MITFKVGILGAGQIAEKLTDCLHKLSGFSPYAVASRDEAKATAFAVTHQIEKSYGSYDELIADPDLLKHRLILQMCRSGDKGVEEMDLPDQRFQHFSDPVPVQCFNQSVCLFWC